MSENEMGESKNSMLSPAVREHIDKWNLRYPPEQKRSGIFEALRVVQQENKGSLTIELMDAVADYLGMPNIAVYEVATFYSLYHLQPVGKHVIDVCTNISCSLNGAAQIVEHLKKRLGIDMNETTPDRKFTLREVECLGACIAPPVCQIGKKYYENLTPEIMDEILRQLEGG
ncbi:MAG: NAD(P)H-dependent oxidoreductase subunit E [Gammaproteobacteria bacterium]|nr:NAD(P)H-dependent oxidoreductase subunit E [Gammaproteobacteria bacterium]MCW5583159.1 NAD(P)H-dependent oxidoreductase subunit E [Gammaproteobacteria bacterium]